MDVESTISFTRGLFFTFEEFLHSYDADRACRADFTYITGTESPVGKYTYVRSTIINDLRPGAESIFNNYQNSTRNKINQVIKNDLCYHVIISSPTDKDLQQLDLHFTPFARSTNIAPLQMSYIRALRRHGRLCICYVYDRDGALLTGHVYRLSPLRPEMFLSFRIAGADTGHERTNFISKANRYSHYCDMLHFKAQGYEEYDFGGVWGTGHTASNIDVFKMSFGGQVRTYHNSILYNTFKSQTYLKVRGNPLA